MSFSPGSGNSPRPSTTGSSVDIAVGRRCVARLPAIEQGSRPFWLSTAPPFSPLAVLLKLCGPFLDPSSPLFWKRVDPAFVAAGGAPASTAGSTAGAPLLDYSGETRLAATREEEAAWRERLASNAAASSTGGGAGSDPSEWGCGWTAERGCGVAGAGCAVRGGWWAGVDSDLAWG